MVDASSPGATAQKRRASIQLESEPVKRARSNDVDEVVDTAIKTVEDAMEQVEAQTAEADSASEATAQEGQAASLSEAGTAAESGSDDGDAVLDTGVEKVEEAVKQEDAQAANHVNASEITAQKGQAASLADGETAGEAGGDDDDEVAPITVEMLEVAMAENERLRSETGETTKQLAAQSAENERLRSELEEVSDERDEWRIKFLDVEDTIKELRKRKGSREEDNMAQLKEKSKKIEETIKQKWEKKLQEQKDDEEAKYADLKNRANARITELKEKGKQELQDRDAKLKKEKNLIMAKQQEELAEMKQKRLQETKKDKESVAALKKTLKEEQQAEIKKHKPETAQAVKESKQQLKEKQAEIKKLQDSYGKMQERVDKYEKGLDRLGVEKQDLEKIVATNKSNIETLNSERQVLEGRIEAILRVHDREKTIMQNKLIEEGKKWLIQFNLAQQAGQNEISHRRACFDLRNANARRDKQIEALTADKESLKAKLEDAEVTVLRLSVDGASEPKSGSGVTLTDEDMAFVNGMAEQSFEAAALRGGWMGADGAYDLA